MFGPRPAHVVIDAKPRHKYVSRDVHIQRHALVLLGPNPMSCSGFLSTSTSQTTVVNNVGTFIYKPRNAISVPHAKGCPNGNIWHRSITN